MKILMVSEKTNPGGWVVQLFTMSRWNHVAAILPDNEHIIHATFKHGVVIDKLSRYDNVSTEIIDIPLPDEEAAVRFLNAQLGKKYDLTALFAIFFRRNWQKDDRWFCSELVEMAVKASGKNRFRDEVSRITPHQIWSVL